MILNVVLTRQHKWLNLLFLRVDTYLLVVAIWPASDIVRSRDTVDGCSISAGASESEEPMSVKAVEAGESLKSALIPKGYLGTFPPVERHLLHESYTQ